MMWAWKCRYRVFYPLDKAPLKSSSLYKWSTIMDIPLTTISGYIGAVLSLHGIGLWHKEYSNKPKYSRTELPPN